MTWDEYAEAWSRLHGGFDPRTHSLTVRAWVRMAYTLGTWLGGRGANPSVVTTIGLIACVAVPVCAPAGRWGLLVGAFLIVFAALADTLDGAVAVVTGRASRLGFVYDSVADRIGELAWLVAFGLAGVPWVLVLAALALSWSHEYVRARAAVAGMPDIGVVTVAERPARVSVAIIGLALGAIAGRPVLIIAAVVWVALAVAGLFQLVRAVRQALS